MVMRVSIEILEKVEHNHFHGKFIHDFGGGKDKDEKEASLFYYSSAEQAQRSYNLMCEHSEHVKINASLHSLVESGRERFYLVTKKLKRWVKDANKVFYQLEDKAKRGLGVGKVSVLLTDEGSRIFGAIITFLGAIHSNGTYHGRIKEGTFIREDGSICFTNFDTSQPPLSLRKGKWKDLDDLCNLIEDTFQGSRSKEYEDFKTRVSKAKFKDFAENSTLFLYNHPFFWTNAMTRCFISKVCEVRLQYGKIFSIHFHLKEAASWWQQVEMLLRTPPTPLLNGSMTSGPSQAGSSQVPVSTSNCSQLQPPPTSKEYWNELYYFENKSPSQTNQARRSQYGAKIQDFVKFSRNGLEHPYRNNKDETLTI